MIDIQEKKNTILEFLKTAGPSLPVHLAKTIQMEPVFASAILSELLSSKLIKISHMRVGSSPLYFLPGQEIQLEEKVDNLKSAERDAQEKLKTKKIIKDEEEGPVVRVALRNIRDFAVPFKIEDKIIWKYAFTPQEEIDEILFPKKEHEPPKKEISNDSDVPKAWEIKKEEIKQAKEKSKLSKNIEKEKPHMSKTFLEEIKQFFETQNIIIISLEEIDKKKVTAIVESEGIQSMLFAFNRAKVDESELLKCYRMSSKKELPYQVIIRGNLTKKLTERISAYQNLIKINKLEN